MKPAQAAVEPVNPPRSGPAIAWKLTLVLIPLFVAGAIFFLRRTEIARLDSHPLGDYGKIPAFQLIDQNGRPFISAELAGKIWIGDFVCTDCGQPSALVSSRLSETERPLRNTDVWLLSFTVHPEHDTPTVLRDYAARLNAAPGRWIFLTGDRSTLDRIFRQVLKRQALAQDQRLVLVDRQGTIRGYYEATQADAVTRVVADAGRLFRQQPPPVR